MGPKMFMFSFREGGDYLDKNVPTSFPLPCLSERELILQSLSLLFLHLLLQEFALKLKDLCPAPDQLLLQSLSPLHHVHEVACLLRWKDTQTE